MQIIKSVVCKIIIFLALIIFFAIGRNAIAQEVNNNQPNERVASITNADSRRLPRLTEPSERERILLERIELLEKRLAKLEERFEAKRVNEEVGTTTAVLPPSQKELDGVKTVSNGIETEDRRVLDFFRNTTINLTLDGYYGYNFNRPVGRVNLLRAYDVISNSFSLNQAGLVIEHAPNVEAGRRFGARLDLMYGQAPESSQGNPNNELRPQAFRNIFQAYGTYVLPIGRGLTVDFGKFSSSLGLEGTYTKDQINYTRSLLFNVLPFYHFGFRATYHLNDRFTMTHWLVNGINQSEDFNGFKSQALILNIKPVKSISLNLNYYTGLESRDSNPILNPGFPTLPTDAIRPVPRGRTHILDSYFTWTVNDKLTIAGEGDYVITRTFPNSAPVHITGGAAYLRYQFTPKFALATRGEYVSDRNGLFSGVSQSLKEITLTAEYKAAYGFLVRAEYRRDFSNQPFFLTSQPGLLKKEQNTATIGLVWWFGRKSGSW
ncbi:MAG: porin [Acidobacteriota bacterium]